MMRGDRSPERSPTRTPADAMLKARRTKTPASRSHRNTVEDAKITVKHWHNRRAPPLENLKLAQEERGAGWHTGESLVLTLLFKLRE